MIDTVATALRNDRGPGPLDGRAASVADWVERVLRERMGEEQKEEEN